MLSNRAAQSMAACAVRASYPVVAVRLFSVTRVRLAEDPSTPAGPTKTNTLLTQLPDAGFEYRDEWSFTYKDGKPSAVKDVLTKGQKKEVEQAADVMMRELELLRFKVVDIERKYQKLREQLPEEMFQQLLKEHGSEALKPNNVRVATQGEFDQ